MKFFRGDFFCGFFGPDKPDTSTTDDGDDDDDNNVKKDLDLILAKH